ncbi:EscU/YscU/HrcU family type III secretion system export apparatus switch protein [Caloramator proteoclasticus]|uniref:Flagellar biosynthesis protein n=1 Tax=Caloramator proteoclasticus DSM 10124 TaxID=1121262 RepID=A0A1M4V6H0_9CLOT|nr:EscU/YscU/HrcU family type III secretion system export apparatus switch protein [Caloramator proteoclasticus]SHE64473.1 flagellar biosynthesis protein [Caloramator proteoclasticus DSM 10124]
MKRKKAVALKYNKDYKAPVVTAVGFGEIAEKILNKAKENDIPIVEDTVLVEKLSKVEPSSPIPEELYEAVARIIAFIYSLDEKHKKKE